jgi:hypothetical protein
MAALVPSGLPDKPADGAALLDHIVGGSDTVAASPSGETAFPTPSGLATTSGSPKPPMAVQTPQFQNGFRSSVSQVTPLETVSPVSRKRTSVAGGVLVLTILVLFAVLYVLWEERERENPLIVPVVQPPALQITEPQVIPDLLETELELGPAHKAETADERKKRRRKRREKKEKDLLEAELKSDPDKKESVEKKPDSEKEKTVKGRFGTKFTSDY